jgi:hypothetical protein
VWGYTHSRTSKQGVDVERLYHESTGGQESAPKTQETVGKEFAVGDAVVFERIDTGYITRPMPILDIDGTFLRIGKGFGKSAFRYWCAYVQPDGSIESEGASFRIVEVNREGGIKDALILATWTACLNSRFGPRDLPAGVELLEKDDFRLIAEMIIKSQQLLDTADKLQIALLTLFDGDVALATEVLSSSIIRLYKVRGDKLDGKLGQYPD